MKAQKAKRRHSLKWSMICMIFLCWGLPVLLVVAGAGVYIFGELSVQTQKTFSLSTDKAMALTEGKLDAAVTATLKASYIPSVKDAWAQYQNDGDDVALYNTITGFLSEQYKYDEKFLNIIVTILSRQDLSCYTSNIANNGSYLGVRKYKEFLEPQILDMSKTLGTKIAFIENDGHCFMVRNLLDAKLEPFAVIAMELNNDALFGALSSIAWAHDSTIWLSGTELPLLGTALEKPDFSAATQSITRNKNTFTIARQSRRSGYTLEYSARMVPDSLRPQQLATVLTLAIILALFFMLIGFVFSFFRRKVTCPIDVLTAAAHEIEAGNFGTQVAAESFTSSDLGYLGDRFNSMSDTILNQFDRIYKEELALRDAKIMALQSQINPHFLNNTLEIINWEARLAGDIKVCNMLESLSTMLSAAMDRNKQHLVHLSQELMYVDAYLYIINERLGKRLNIVREIDESLLDAFVPRLILQPILENAVEHGINPTQQGTITLRAYREEDFMMLEVENSGVMEPLDLEKIEALLSDDTADGVGSTSLGIRNVHQRLRIIYGAESGLFVKIAKNGNTIFTMKLILHELEQ
ncbi:MAG: sensor histidine kinase [Oscillospiraceae bacterium]